MSTSSKTTQTILSSIGLAVGFAVTVGGAVGGKKQSVKLGVGIVGAVVFVVSLVWLILVQTATASASSSPASQPLMRSAPAPTPALAANAPDTTTVRWPDQASRDAQPLESIKQFNDEESPRSVSASPIETRAAHPPKAVPARPRRQTGYAPAVVPATPAQTQALADAFAHYTIETPPNGGPVYYSPEYNYPVVSDMVAERERFLARPDTPELARYRRVSALQEAAASLGPCVQQDGLMVPIAGPPVPTVTDLPPF